jgi:hypothetical protein
MKSAMGEKKEMTSEDWEEIARNGTAFAVASSLESGIRVLKEEIEENYLNWDEGSQLEMREFIVELSDRLLRLLKEIYRTEWDVFREEHPDEFQGEKG